MYSVNQVLGSLTHCPIGWVNFPRKSRVSFNYKSTHVNLAKQKEILVNKNPRKMIY